MVVGLSKLQSTTEEVKVLQEQLKEMKPALQIAAKDADEMIKIIAADTVSVFFIHFRSYIRFGFRLWLKKLKL